MVDFQSVQHDFSRGEIPLIDHRADVAFYHQGCRIAKNMTPLLFGGLEVRKGYDYSMTLPFTASELLSIEFEDSVGKGWLIVLVAGKAYVIDANNPTQVFAEIVVPYDAGELKYISYVQREDVLILTHGNHQPSQIVFNGTSWTFSALGITNAPKEDDSAIWTTNKGFPRYVCLWRGRLCFFGTKTYPTHYWFSRTYNEFDFERATDSDDGTGSLLDDAAIFGSISGEGGPIISNVYADNALYIVSTRGVYAYASKVAPTPTNFNPINYAPDVRTVRGVPRPLRIDGHLVCVVGTPVRRLLSIAFDEDYGNLTGDDIAVLRGTINPPVSLAGSFGLSQQGSSNHLYVVSEDGSLSVWLTVQQQSIAAWSSREILGKVLAVSVVNQEVFLITQHDGKIHLLREGSGGLDYRTTQTAGAKSVWSVPTYLRVFSDAVAIAGDQVVELSKGATSVTFPDAVSSVDFGVVFGFELQTMPLSADGQGLSLDGVNSKIQKVTLRLENATTFFVNGDPVDLSKLGDVTLNKSAEGYSGSVTMRQLGWSGNWLSIEQSVNVTGRGHFSMQIKKITLEGKVGT